MSNPKSVPHALNCPKHPNAEAPKMEGCMLDCRDDSHNPACKAKPAPAPEPPKTMKMCWCAESRMGFPCDCAPASEPKQGSACPGCGHQTHGSVCMNFGSDNECPCKAGQQGSAEPERGGHSHAEACFDPSCQKPGILTVFEAQNQTIAALRAEVERLKRDAARHEEEEAANCPEDQSCIETIKALRAQLADAREQSERTKAEKQELWRALRGRVEKLAQAREEIAKLKERIASMDEDITEWGEADAALTAICNREFAAREKAEARVKELSDVLGEVLEALRVHAPGTALNSREFDSLGCKARAILAARAKEGEKR